MHLDELTRMPIAEDLGRLTRALQAGRDKGVRVPGIYWLMNARPDFARGLNDAMEAIMRGPGVLSPGEREMIAGYVSSRNHCVF